MFTPEELLKLPKWASQKVTCLQHDLKTANTKIATMSGEEQTALEIAGDIRAPKLFLPEHSTVRFHLQPTEGYRREIYFHLAKDGVECYANNRLLVSPQSTNHILLLDSQ